MGESMLALVTTICMFSMLLVEVAASLSGNMLLVIVLTSPHQRLPMGWFTLALLITTCTLSIPLVEVIVSPYGDTLLVLLSTPHQPLPTGWSTLALTIIIYMHLGLLYELYVHFGMREGTVKTVSLTCSRVQYPPFQQWQNWQVWCVKPAFSLRNSGYRV